jgi:citrate lyase subunit beta/citryl-CoA lyase
MVAAASPKVNGWLTWVAMAPRCYLFVPGDRPAMLAKAHLRGADAVIVDLEDAVAPSARTEAFAATGRWLRERDPSGPEAWVRIPRHDPNEEVAEIVAPGLTGIMLPKVRGPGDVAEVWTAAQRAGGGRPIGLIVLIETAAGLQLAGELAGTDGVVRLMSGEVDLAADLGIDPKEEAAWWPIRSRIVVASAAAGLSGPIGPVSPDFSDPDAASRRARRLYRHGFRAGAAIHPAQIEAYRTGFAPDRAAVVAAERLVAGYEAALAEGRGTIVDDRGHMVDEAMVKAARRLLAEA